MRLLFVLFFLLSSLITLQANEKPTIRVSSKVFTESYILAEIITQIIEDVGEAKVERKYGLGGTGITFNALKTDGIDIYPEYTGTIAEAILKNKDINTVAGINEALAVHGLMISESLGFNNTYALAVGEKSKNLKKISDLQNNLSIPTAFTHEFIKRKDGLKGLQEKYRLNLKNTVGMEHSLIYEALKQGQIDLMEVYSTDAKILKYNLNLLKDDLNYFPRYEGVLFLNKNLKEKFPKTWAALNQTLIGKINNEKMISLNAMVELDKKDFNQVAGSFLGKGNLKKASKYKEIKKLTLEHIKIVFISLLFSILIGIPLGVISSKNKLAGQFFLTVSGLLQTIPGLALLCFLIPFVGIGELPAYIALFLYGLLPIVRNTYTGIISIDPKILESSKLMGLSKFQQLRFVQLPLASMNIMAGIKTTAVINVGMATLAAFIGAGGLGNLIVTGLNLNDNHIILQGAIPAALLAIIIHLLFEFIDRLVIPKGIR